MRCEALSPVPVRGISLRLPFLLAAIIVARHPAIVAASSLWAYPCAPKPNGVPLQDAAVTPNGLISAGKDPISVEFFPRTGHVCVGQKFDHNFICFNKQTLQRVPDVLFEHAVSFMAQVGDGSMFVCDRSESAGNGPVTLVKQFEPGVGASGISRVATIGGYCGGLAYDPVDDTLYVCYEGVRMMRITHATMRGGAPRETLENWPPAGNGDSSCFFPTMYYDEITYQRSIVFSGRFAKFVKEALIPQGTIATVYSGGTASRFGSMRDSKGTLVITADADNSVLTFQRRGLPDMTVSNSNQVHGIGIDSGGTMWIPFI